MWLNFLLANSALSQCAIYVIRPAISYRTLELHGSIFQLGLIGACYALLPVLVAISFGRLATRVGEGKFLVIGTLGITTVGISLGFVHSLLLIGILSALAGMSHLVCMIGGQSMVAIESASSAYAKNFGYYTFSASLGQTIGPALAGLVLGASFFAFQPTRLTLIVGGCVALLGLLPAVRISNIASKTASEPAPLKISHALKSQPIRRAIIVSTIVSSSVDLLVIYLPALGVDRNYAPRTIGMILAIRALTAMVARLALGKLSERYLAKEILFGSLLLSGLSAIAIFFSESAIYLGFLIFILGLASGVAQPLTMALVAEEVSSDAKTQMIAIRLLGNRSGQLIFPLVAGAVVSALSIESMFVVLGIGLLAPLIKRAA